MRARFAALVVITGATSCAVIADLDQFHPQPPDAGASGAAGASGTSGTSGTSGASGASGASGSSGAAGAAGSDGAVLTYADIVKSDNPIGYWRLGESSGSTAEAVIGSVGTYKGPNCVLGASGAITGDTNSALELAGDCRIDFGSVFDFTDTTKFSLEAWVKPTIIDAQLHRLFSKEQTGTAGRQGYTLTLDGSSISFDRWRDGSADGADTPTNALQAGVFSHVVATFDGSSLRIFVNGSQQGGVSGAKMILPVTEPFVAGASSTGTNFFAGVLDELAVYSDALPQPRVKAHYDAGLGAQR